MTDALMMKPARRKPRTDAAGHESAFREIIGLIAAARSKDELR